MDLSSKITELRKKKDWSQAELARQIDVSREIVGRYERGDATPSIDIAKRIADAFGVSLDFLVGDGINVEFDKNTVKRIQDILKLEPETQDKMWFFIDTIIRDAKARQAYGSAS